MLTTITTPTTPAPSGSENYLTRCWVVWENGYKKKFRSYDTSGRYQVDDPRRYGIQGLFTRILNREWPSPLKEVRLYDNQTGVLLDTWVSNGVRLV